MQVRLRQRLADDRPAVRIARSRASQHDLVPRFSHIRPGQPEGGVPGHDAVKLQRQTLRGHHCLAATVGAADEVRVFGATPIKARDDGFRQQGRLVDRVVGVIDAGLLVEGEMRIDQGRAAMTPIRGDDRETPRKPGGLAPAVAP